MGQDWKTLSLVVVAAAIAGWLAVRQLAPGSARRQANAPAPLPPIAAEPTEDAASAAPHEEVAKAPAAPVRSASAPAAADDATDLAAIERDLELLSQALVKDQRIEDRVMPRINDALDVPGVVQYRRAPDFWEPALSGSRGANQ